MPDKPTCPLCGGGLESTADRGRYGRIPHYAICCTCATEWTITRQGDSLVINQLDPS